MTGHKMRARQKLEGNEKCRSMSAGVPPNLFRVFDILLFQLSGSNITLNPSADFAIFFVFAKTTLLRDVFDLFETWIQTLAFFAVCSIRFFVAAISTVPIASTIVVLIVAKFIPFRAFTSCTGAFARAISLGTQLAQEAEP